jgi:sulfofructose kinase
MRNCLLAHYHHMIDVVGIGENSVDYVYRVAAYPRPASATAKIPITAHQLLPGGQVATTLAACAALGLRAKYAGAFGNDSNADLVREALARRGVDVSDAIVRSAPNRFAVIVVEQEQGERVVLWQRDARLDLTAEDLRHQIVQQARVLHVDDVDENAAIAAAHVAREAGVTVTSDIDRVTSRTEDLIAAVTIPIFSAHVPQALTGASDIESALRALGQRHNRWLCVTLGAEGSMLLDGDQMHRAAAFRVGVVDTTGAGDVFRGAFIYALLQGRGPGEILRFANAAAAVSCTREGAMDSVPSLLEVEQLLVDDDTPRHRGSENR